MNKEIIKLNRIRIEKELFEKDIKYYNDNGIYLEYDENNKNIVYILYIIKYNNIYKHSQHFFKFQYTENYPFEPPKLTYLTARKKARIHPNFYSNGKCCLSLLGTWHGPQWTSCNNITSIINSIIPLFTDNPLQFEPTFEDIVKHKKYNDTYNIYIFNEIHKLLIINIDNNILPNKLSNIMNDYYINNFEDIINNIITLKDKDNTLISTPVYHHSSFINYNELYNDLYTLYNKIKKV